jgi:hypothetical protein
MVRYLSTCPLAPDNSVSQPLFLLHAAPYNLPANAQDVAAGTALRDADKFMASQAALFKTRTPSDRFLIEASNP